MSKRGTEDADYFPAQREPPRLCSRTKDLYSQITVPPNSNFVWVTQDATLQSLRDIQT